MPLEALVYCSQVVPGLSPGQNETLVAQSAAHNKIAGVTGILLFDGARFLQYIEGPEDGVALTYSRILGSSSHCEVVELARASGGARRFPYWALRLIRVAEPDLRIAISSEWRGLRRLRDHAMFQVPTGIDRMNELVRPQLEESR